MAYKCKKCNKLIKRKNRQWRSNYARFKNARICRECFYNLWAKIDKLKREYNNYRRKVYPNASYYFLRGLY